MNRSTDWRKIQVCSDHNMQSYLPHGHEKTSSLYHLKIEYKAWKAFQSPHIHVHLVWHWGWVELRFTKVWAFKFLTSNSSLTLPTKSWMSNLGSLLASTSRLRGVNRKWTSSAEFGLCRYDLNRAWNKYRHSFNSLLSWIIIHNVWWQAIGSRIRCGVTITLWTVASHY